MPLVFGRTIGLIGVHLIDIMANVKLVVPLVLGSVFVGMRGSMVSFSVLDSAICILCLDYIGVSKVLLYPWAGRGLILHAIHPHDLGGNDLREILGHLPGMLLFILRIYLNLVIWVRVRIGIKQPMGMIKLLSLSIKVRVKRGTDEVGFKLASIWVSMHLGTLVPLQGFFNISFHRFLVSRLTFSFWLTGRVFVILSLKVLIVLKLGGVRAQVFSSTGLTSSDGGSNMPTFKILNWGRGLGTIDDYLIRLSVSRTTGGVLSKATTVTDAVLHQQHTSIHCEERTF